MPEHYLPNEEIIVITWICTKCGKEFQDADEGAWVCSRLDIPAEPKEYWLGPTEPVCQQCAINIGLPAIDKE